MFLMILLLLSVNSHMYDCKVIVKDIFANDETEKFKALNVSQDKIHSAHSRKSADLDVPDYLEKNGRNQFSIRMQYGIARVQTNCKQAKRQ